MGIVVIPSFGSDPATVTAATLDAKVDGLGSEFNGNIENANVKAGAAIANSKLNLTNVTQDVTLAGTNVLSGATTISGALTQSGIITMTAKIFKGAKGADVASAAGNIALGDDGNYFDITGTDAITSITAKTAGTVVVLQFDSTASLVDGSNLKLTGNFTGAAEAQIMLVSDGTNWIEVARNSQISFASDAEVKTGSETGKIVSPSTLVSHEGVIKAWGSVTYTTGTPALANHFNITSISDTGTGDIAVTIATDFGNTDYAVVASADRSGSASSACANYFSRAAGTVSIFVAATGDASAIDPVNVSFIMIGDR